jgi:hypothetical protein
VSVLRRHLGAVAGLVCLVLGALLVLLAVDVRTWQSTFARDDLRFRALHSHLSLWRSGTLLPGDPAARLLGVGDALMYRHALQLFWYSRVGSDPESRQDLPTTRVEAQDSLERLMNGARTATERSSAANLLGVLVVSSPPGDSETQVQLLRRATEYFQRAIEIDPGNARAKLNLELVLRLRRPGKSRFGKDARGGYGFGRGRGVGVTGSGY